MLRMEPGHNSSPPRDRPMIQIDGSMGEGGGQVLRTALSLSVITGQPVTLTHIRQGRSKPGLMAQHLKAVDAAAAISRASVEGAALGSTQLRFEPGEIRSGRYRFEIGTAGSTLLVLQTIFTPLSLASSASSIIIYGGTHVSWSPSFHYVDLMWLPTLRRMGFDAQLKLDLAGFYPPGGGRISATIRPAAVVTFAIADPAWGWLPAGRDFRRGEFADEHRRAPETPNHIAPGSSPHDDWSASRPPSYLAAAL